MGASLAALIALTTLQVIASPGTFSIVLFGLVAVVTLAVVLHRRAVRDLEHGRRQETESYARILRGLSRSVSPDAIVDAIVEDLGEAAGADHTVVVRLRPEGRLLEATLVSSRAGVPSSTTILPPGDLDDPGPGGIRTATQPVAVPVEPDLDVFAGGGPVRSSVPVTPERVHEEWHDPYPREAVGGAPVHATPSRAPQAPSSRVRMARPFAPPPAVPDAAAMRIADRIAARVGDTYGLRNLVAAPLRVDGAVVGAIVLSRRLAAEWPAASMRLLSDSAAEASAALARAYSHRAAEARASTDGLTGLPNRRYFDEFCGLLARRRRADDAVGVLMIDIDHFKALNDTYGHPAGDAVLKAVADAVARAVRDEDVPARYGGEEFAVLLRNPSPSVALDVGERVRAAVAALDLKALGPERVTVSVGVAMARTVDQPISEIVDQADHALYRAKRLGRDRVVAA